MTILESIKKIHKSKQPISLDQIVGSGKFKHSDGCFNYFIDYKKVKLLNRYALSYLKLVDT